MSTTGKVLAALNIVAALAFFYLGSLVLDTNRYWNERVVGIQKQVSAARDAIAELRDGNTAGNSKLEEIRGQFERQVQEYVQPQTTESYRAAIARLNELASQGIIGPTEWDQPFMQYDQARADLDRRQDTLAGQLDEFFTNVRQLASPGNPDRIGNNDIREMIKKIQLYTAYQSVQISIRESDMDRNLAHWQDLVSSAENDVVLLRRESENAEKMEQENTEELEMYQTKLAQETQQRDQELAALNQLRNEVADLQETLGSTVGRIRQLVAVLKKAEIRLDQSNGDPSAIITDTGEIPRGVVQRVSGNDGSITFNIGTRKGVHQGARLHVFRFEPDPAYLGKLVVRSSSSDDATGQMEPAYRQVTVRVGDIVSPEVKP